MTDLLPLALTYASQGWPVFPLNRRGKHPIGALVPHGFKDASTDTDTIRRWWRQEPEANIGIPTGIAFDAGDFDTKEAMDSFIELCKVHDLDPHKLPRVETGRGGRHVLLDPTGLGNKAAVMPGMDWRGKGGYIVAPGSIHENGNAYRWVYEPSGTEFPSAPDWLLDLLSPKPPKTAVSGKATTQPSPAYIDRALESELSAVRTATEGQRNDQLNRSAFALGQMVGSGWITAMRAETELVAAGVAAGLESKETRNTVRSGLTSGALKPREPLDSLKGGEIRRGKPQTVPTPYWYQASTLKDLELTPARVVVAGLIVVGLNMLCGKGKLGKSWLALDVAIAVSSGTQALTSIATTQGDVLYLALEDNRRRMQTRIDQLGHGFPPRLTVGHECPKLDAGGLELIRDWIEAHPEATLVVVDVWKRVRQVRAKNANIYDEDYEHLMGLQALAMQADVAILVVHHTRKASAEDAFDEISGSGGILAALDTCLILHRPRGEGDGEIWVTGRDVDEDKLALKLEDGQWQLLGSAAAVTKSKSRRSVRDVMAQAGAALTPTEVANALGWPNGRVRQLLFQMVTAGEIRRLPNSKYTLLPPLYSPNTQGRPNSPNSLTEEGAGWGVRALGQPPPRARGREGQLGCPACGGLAYRPGPDGLPQRCCHSCQCVWTPA